MIEHYRQTQRRGGAQASHALFLVFRIGSGALRAGRRSEVAEVLPRLALEADRPGAALGGWRVRLIAARWCR
jgi:hypothetical protein